MRQLTKDQMREAYQAFGEYNHQLAVLKTATILEYRADPELYDAFLAQAEQHGVAITEAQALADRAAAAFRDLILELETQNGSTDD